jgi:hypothetical protein
MGAFLCLLPVTLWEGLSFEEGHFNLSVIQRIRGRKKQRTQHPEAEAGGLKVQGQPGLHSDTLS